MENKLLHDVKNGDEAAFAKLYEKYVDYALRVASAVTRSEANAADAVQETFIRIYRHIKDFDLNKPFEPWFYKILLNECNRVLKNKSKTVCISDYMEKTLSMSGEDSYRFEEYEELYRAIGELQDINRIPIILKYIKGFKEAEIADILGININTLKSRLFKGRQKLRSFLEEFRERRGVYG